MARLGVDRASSKEVEGVLALPREAFEECPGANTGLRAAASSMARGRPSRCRQIAATAAALVSSNRKA